MVVIPTWEQRLTFWVGRCSERVCGTVSSSRDDWQRHKGAVTLEASEEGDG